MPLRLYNYELFVRPRIFVPGNDDWKKLKILIYVDTGSRQSHDIVFELRVFALFKIFASLPRLSVFCHRQGNLLNGIKCGEIGHLYSLTFMARCRNVPNIVAFLDKWPH
jgi:hypothetical protein